MVALQALSLGLLASQALAIPAASQQAATATLPTTASSSTAVASSQLDQLANFAYNVTTDSVAGGSESKRGGCTLQNLRVRRDWRAFSKTQKKDYINSVLCLQKLPSRTPAHLAPGARTRYDDFVATHINQTQIIHYTGTFLAWHRYFIYEFEQALRDECSYTGDYPYWNWGADADNMEKSQVFDGSETSMSGNGEYIPNQGDIKLLLGNYPAIDLPPGSGGGCVTSGPFKDYKLNLGPAALSLPGGNMTAAANPLTYNPRCLKRSLTTEILQRYNTFPKIVELILDNDDIWDFQMTMQGVPGSGSIGVHGGGHYSMGATPNLDLRKRQNAISGTGTFMNNPASPNTTLDTVIDIGYANGGPIAMRDLMSTTAGPFCYVYL
ncbi:tyrosinase [Aspergillus arachidicola]|uniref:Tyrosinase n=1 Tax=Aspergillus arachidicola TaxID=656916 RepID=A0A2G7FKJ2_9EURO|nr:tyrosinase [Aspergillus arachidicola]